MIFFRAQYCKNQCLWRHLGNMMSPSPGGVWDVSFRWIDRPATSHTVKVHVGIPQIEGRRIIVCYLTECSGFDYNKIIRYLI
jgi:hypothetical protein